MDGTQKPLDAGALESQSARPQAVMRFADWTLTTDKQGSGPVYEAECMTCSESSDAAENKDEPELWCLRHAGALGHTGFRGITTAFFRAALVNARSGCADS
ncbi:hypothetical protein [Streptomyces sp. V1I1]|uniref:DUF7848 domain-containing protein n=1 Tax=Streptomyces sp. V1I1 TaxID=3042272 RepID=UPI002785286F|nr:hypothetical protein [Streptomyces sp. V1I1]MDQ0941780.1 hypothetical protein [Streptomyces sp. V1I1]